MKQMKSRKSEIVKLQIHVEEGNETFIESYPAKSWDKFVLIAIPQIFTNEQVQSLSESIRQLDSERVYIFIPSDNLDKVSVYGIKELE